MQSLKHIDARPPLGEQHNIKIKYPMSLSIQYEI